MASAKQRENRSGNREAGLARPPADRPALAVRLEMLATAGQCGCPGWFVMQLEDLTANEERQKT